MGGTMMRAAFVMLMSAIACVGAADAETPLERGDYLVNGILTCGNCHTPRGPGGVFLMEKQLSGGPQTWDEPTFKVKGSNITPDRESGIGTWSDADIKAALQTGHRPNGVQIAPIMPYAFYKVFTPDDLDAVVVYLRSVTPIRNAVDPPTYKEALHVDPVPNGANPMPEADLIDPVKRGFYLITIGHCMECHTPVGNDHHEYGNLGKGEQGFRGPWGESTSRNITSDKEKGLGAWTDAEIKRAITQGISRDGSRLKPPMAFALYATMTPGDLDAVVAYLRTVPPK
jgi:mono/diheme cytochrome c family protein